MKKFALLHLFPVYHPDYTKVSGNKSLLEKIQNSEMEAIRFFQESFPHLNLNDNGYSKIGEDSYCVSQVYPY